MSKDITIQHPPAGKIITSRAFVACGQASEVADVRGVLKGPTQHIVAEGRTLQRPPRWIIQFPALEVFPGNYVLEVIEVGVNVPNATVMIVEDADRFGLSQLHQLRGRVGRGADVSWCFLVADPTTPDGEARMEAIAASTDGFLLAEKDLETKEFEGSAL